MNTLSLRAYYIVVLVMVSAVLYAQKADTTRQHHPIFTNLQLEAKWNGGFLWAHSPTVAYLQRQHTMGGEFSISKPISGQKHWHTFYEHNIVGLAYQHYYLGYNDVLGSANGLYLFSRFNLAGQKSTHLRFSLGTGITWLSKTFDKDENHKNVTIGSHLNALVNFQLLLDQRISRHLYFNAGLTLTHYSNGAFKTPNLGLNLPGVTAGLAYRMYPEPTPNRFQKSEFERAHGFIFSVVMAVGRKEIYPPNGKGYGVMTLSFNMVKPLGIKSGLILTFDLFNDRTIPAIIKRDNPATQLSYGQTIRPGIAFGYDLWLGNLNFIFQAGVYPYTYYKGDGKIYSRLGWRYRLPYGFMANLTLKTHFAKADNIEFGIGYVLFNKPRVLRLL